jgi:hypothetical protein
VIKTTISELFFTTYCNKEKQFDSEYYTSRIPKTYKLKYGPTIKTGLGGGGWGGWGVGGVLKLKKALFRNNVCMQPTIGTYNTL